jgi:hypothetical protein
MNTTVFCITGWHFPRVFYQSISNIDDVDVIVISHKRRPQIPAYIFDLIPAKNLLICSNIGYDWGCYQQFLQSGIWRNYETLFFMHDDIKIHDFGFIAETKKLLESHAVIGNGKGAGSVSYTGVLKHPYAYVHSKWKPDSIDFQHHTVRGSFFASTRRTLEKAYPLEVYWDPFKINIEFGNWSTKASCGKLEYLFGPDCFGYLSETHGRSHYLTEHYRGEGNHRAYSLQESDQGLYAFLKRISIVYMDIYYHRRPMRNRWFWLMALKTILWPFSSKLY